MVKLFHIFFFFESLVDQHEDSSGLLWHAAYIYGIIKKKVVLLRKKIYVLQPNVPFIIFQPKSPKQTNVQFTMKYEQEQILSKELLIYVFILD